MKNTTTLKVNTFIVHRDDRILIKHSTEEDVYTLPNAAVKDEALPSGKTIVKVFDDLTKGYKLLTADFMSTQYYANSGCIERRYEVTIPPCPDTVTELPTKDQYISVEELLSKKKSEFLDSYLTEVLVKKLPEIKSISIDSRNGNVNHFDVSHNLMDEKYGLIYSVLNDVLKDDRELYTNIKFVNGNGVRGVHYPNDNLKGGVDVSTFANELFKCYTDSYGKSKCITLTVVTDDSTVFEDKVFDNITDAMEAVRASFETGLSIGGMVGFKEGCVSFCVLVEDNSEETISTFLTNVEKSFKAILD